MDLKTRIFLPIALIGLSLVACQGNRMKIDEKKLFSEMSQEEREEAERLDWENKLADSLKKLPPGFRFNEERSVDKSRPPIVIDLAGNLDHVRDLALSNVASKITYIRLEKVPDTGFSRVMKYKYYLMDNNIVAVNPFGIQLFTKNGKFLATVVKNEFTGIEVTRNEMTTMSDNTFVGGGPSVWAVGNNLYYKYINSLTGQAYVMEYNCSKPTVNIVQKYDPEKPNMLRGEGMVAFDMNFGKEKVPTTGNGGNMYLAHVDYIYGSLNSMMLDRSTFVKKLSSPYSLGGDFMMAVFNQRGDTLATFTQFEQVTEFSKSVMRGTDQGDQYENNGKYYFRNAFNDTVFQMVPPNRLLPVFVLKLGTYKLSKTQGVNPDYNLKRKIIPYNWADTKNYVFLSFSKDSYVCPYTMQTKELHLYHALYSKCDHNLYIVKSDPVDYEAEILRNDLDGGCPVWPDSYMVGKHGEIMISLKGYEIKDRVKSKQFSKSTAPADKKNQLAKLAHSLSDDDDILMIVE